MQREIKFRGKRIDNGEWVYGFYRPYTFYNRFDNSVIYTKHFIGAFDNVTNFDGLFEQVEIAPETIGQFTGLTDKNGTDIYEGDYIYLGSYHGKGIVVYANGSYKVKGNVSNRLIGFGSFSKQVEVIGNIHTNPELIK